MFIKYLPFRMAFIHLSSTVTSCVSFSSILQDSLLTFSNTPRDNVVMVRESLLSNMSCLCDERMLCEHVKHLTPHTCLFLSASLHPTHHPKSGVNNKKSKREAKSGLDVFANLIKSIVHIES